VNDTRVLTLQEFADDYLTPMMLDLVGLPNTPSGRRALDVILATLPEDDE
jgi:hypothetical protein